MTELLINDRAVLVDVLVAHQRLDIEGCLCGWNDLGRSHAEHVAAVYEDSIRARQPGLTPTTSRVVRWAVERLDAADEAAAASQRHAAAGTGQHAMTGYARCDERAKTIRGDVRALLGWPS